MVNFVFIDYCVYHNDLECREIPATAEEGRCQCFEFSKNLIDDMKTTQFTINIPNNETVERTCIKALSNSSPLVKRQTEKCINALRGKFCFL